MTDTSTTGDNAASVEPRDHICSGKGCRAEAVHAVIWRNPKLHTPERRKVWLACEEHRAHLSDFVAARGFLIEVIPVGDLTERDG